MITTWIPTATQFPPPGKNVLAYYTNDAGNSRRVRAEWVPAKTLEASGDNDDFGEYDDATDTFYWPEGWYEKIDNWDDLSAVFISHVVTHWMAMPDGPEGAKE